ncbi:hypothetical protein HNR02_002665 [Amycolatopsis endophytica]|uniref:Uncharacterized protein n=1 Tax=Amycolatopsis endophytica TaxID=860233 RepID=A0A853B3C4_9PSEU|nr:hypothetical protein [Amycolatopsis endophytica]NYI89342.1 hypothetical protein [Amycolatopsis endophytica]
MDKLQRFNPWPIFLYNSRATHGPDSRRLNWAERGLLYGFPTAALVTFIAFRLQLGGVPQLLAATSLLVGTMLSAFVYLSNLRIKIQETADYRTRVRLKELVASSAVGALHVCVIAMVLALMLALMASWPELTSDSVVANIASGIAVWLLLHLLVSFSSVLRRLLGIYVELFMSDFMAKPDSEPVPRRPA